MKKFNFWLGLALLLVVGIFSLVFGPGAARAEEGQRTITVENKTDLEIQIHVAVCKSGGVSWESSSIKSGGSYTFHSGGGSFSDILTGQIKEAGLAGMCGSGFIEVDAINLDHHDVQFYLNGESAPAELPNDKNYTLVLQKNPEPTGLKFCPRGNEPVGEVSGFDLWVMPSGRIDLIDLTGAQAPLIDEVVKHEFSDWPFPWSEKIRLIAETAQASLASSELTPEQLSYYRNQTGGLQATAPQAQVVGAISSIGYASLWSKNISVTIESKTYVLTNTCVVEKSPTMPKYESITGAAFWWQKSFKEGQQIQVDGFSLQDVRRVRPGPAHVQGVGDSIELSYGSDLYGSWPSCIWFDEELILQQEGVFCRKPGVEQLSAPNQVFSGEIFTATASLTGTGVISTSWGLTPAGTEITNTFVFTNTGLSTISIEVKDSFGFETSAQAYVEVVEKDDPCAGYEPPDLGVAPHIMPLFYGDTINWTGWTTATINSTSTPTVTISWIQSLNDSILISETEILKDGERVFYGGEDATIGLGPQDGKMHEYEFRMTGRARTFIGQQCSAYSVWNEFEVRATYHITWDWWRQYLPIIMR